MTTTRTTAKSKTVAEPPADAFARRVASADWESVADEVDEHGCALLPPLLTPEECALLLLVEQRPRAQSRGTAVLIPQGHGLIFTTRDRPVPSKRGWSASPVRHGVSTIRSGNRYTLGLVFHDAS